MLKKICLLFGAILISANVVLSNTRFVNSVFNDVDTIKKIYFQSAINYLGVSDSLFIDFYSPKNDTMKHRPLVIIIHGGSFLTGTRDDAFCVTTAADFAKRGFNAASINYRIGLDETQALVPGGMQYQFSAAAYRAIQDTKAAVKFLKKNSNVYKVDTNHVYLCGYSAGAVTAIHYAHMQPNEFASIADTTGLGFMEDNDLSVSSKINGYVSFAGAIFDTSWIEKDDVPFISFHGTKDKTLPYDKGNAFSLPIMPYLYGSSSIHISADQKNITNKLVSYIDETHDFVSTPNLLNASLDTAALFLATLMSTSSVKQPIISSKLKVNENKGMYFARGTYNLNGRKLSTTIRASDGIYITNYKRVKSFDKKDFIEIK